MTYTGEPQHFFKNVVSAKTVHLQWKWKRQDKMEEGCQNTKILEAGNRLIKLISWKYVLPFKKKDAETWSQKLEPWAEWLELEACGVESQAKHQNLECTDDYSQTLTPNEICPAGFQICIRPVAPFFPLCFPFGMRISIIVTLCLVQHLWRGFLASQVRRWKRFCLRTGHTQGPIYSWFRWFRLWDAGCLIWWYLNEGFLDLKWYCNGLRLLEMMGWYEYIVCERWTWNFGGQSEL